MSLLLVAMPFAPSTVLLLLVAMHLLLAPICIECLTLRCSRESWIPMTRAAPQPNVPQRRRRRTQSHANGARLIKNDIKMFERCTDRITSPTSPTLPFFRVQVLDVFTKDPVQARKRHPEASPVSFLVIVRWYGKRRNGKWPLRRLAK